MSAQSALPRSHSWRASKTSSQSRMEAAKHDKVCFAWARSAVRSHQDTRTRRQNAAREFRLQMITDLEPGVSTVLSPSSTPGTPSQEHRTIRTTIGPGPGDSRTPPKRPRERVGTKTLSGVME
eukprot:7390847-Prymnesium_polylepis.3